MKKENEVVRVAATTFECIICKGVMKRPQYASCCKRVIGCQSCIEQWLDEKLSCPHCSTTTVLVSSYKDVRGFDDFLNLLCLLSGNLPIS